MSAQPRRNWRPRWPMGVTLAALALLTILAVTQGQGAASQPISAIALHQRLATETAPLVLDVRSPAEYTAGHIPGARNLPYQTIPEHFTTLSAFRDREIVVYCEVGVRASIAQHLLEQAGFTQVQPLAGDLRGWREAALPLATQNLENTP